MKYIICLLMLVGLLGCSQPSDLPEIPVQYLDGTSQDISGIQGKTMLVLYQPGCDHCQRAASTLEQNLQSFKEYEVYFISSAPVYENKQFATEYKLINQPNIHFGTTLGDYIIKNFGSIPTPSFYIYSSDGKLIKEFIGETPIEEILAQI